MRQKGSRNRSLRPAGGTNRTCTMRRNASRYFASPRVGGEIPTSGEDRAKEEEEEEEQEQEEEEEEGRKNGTSKKSEQKRARREREPG